MGYVKIDDGKMMELAVSAPLGIYGKILDVGLLATLFDIFFL
jgi:hypothetical protein